MRFINIPQGDDAWHEERNGCVTGTRFQQAVGAKFSKAKGWTLGHEDIQHTLLCELVSDKQSVLEITDFSNDAMERGNELEPFSVEAASATMGVMFETCGMLQHDTIDDFKFSPDAIYKEEGVVIGGYETKSKTGKKHIEYIMADEVPKEHFWQCVCPMVMDDSVKWWAFGHYDDRNEVNDLFLKVIKRDEVQDLIDEARPILEAFIIKVNETNKQMIGE